MIDNNFYQNEFEGFGEVSKEPVFSHSVRDEVFYKFEMATLRLSGEYDYMPILVSKEMVDISELKKGASVSIIRGKIRTANIPAPERGEGLSRLTMSVLPNRRLGVIVNSVGEMKNEVLLKGFLCKPPIQRETPFGREICDINLAINRSNDKVDYIPCITWGYNAKFAGCLYMGAGVSLTGRVQSREYGKNMKFSDLKHLDSFCYTGYEKTDEDGKVYVKRRTIEISAGTIEQIK